MQFPPGEHWSLNVEPVAYLDLDGRPGFKMALHNAGSRWFFYVAHLWEPGWSIVDVTDAAHPRHLRFIPGPPNTWTIQIQIADARMITALEKIPKQWSPPPDPDAGNEEGFLIWDLADPENPTQLGHYRTGGSGTHRNYYAGGRYVHATALPEGFDGHIYQIVDIADPAHPVEISRWWRKGQWIAGGEAGVPFGTMLHGGAYVAGERAYLPYSAGGFVILDIADVKQPRLSAILPFSPPFQSFIAVHTAQPLPERRLVVVNSEAIAENCDEPLGYAGLVDIADESEAAPCLALSAAGTAAWRAVQELLPARRTLRPAQPAPAPVPERRCCATTTSCSSPISTPACASTTSPIRGCRARPAISSRPTRPCGAGRSPAGSCRSPRTSSSMRAASSMSATRTMAFTCFAPA